MTGEQAAEPDLAEVQREFPAWRCWQAISQLYYARHTTAGTQVQGEDPLDLRDQIRAAEARLAWGQGEPGPRAPGQTQLP